MRKPKPMLYAAAALLAVSAGIPSFLDSQAADVTHSRPVKTPRLDSERDAIPFDRAQWGLSEQEWTRYQTLMRGIRGAVSPRTISPLEVLGIHARSEQERAKYARLWVETMQADTERILAFQRAAWRAWTEKNPDRKIIDASRLDRSQPAPALQKGDRLLVFLRLKDCPTCRILLPRIRQAARETDAQLDIYFTDTRPTEDDAAVLAWARDQRFDPDRLKNRRVTFNHDNGALTRVGGPAATAPAAFRLRGGTIEPLKTETL